MATTTKSKKTSQKPKTTAKPAKTAAAKTTKKATPAKKTAAAKAPVKAAEKQVAKSVAKVGKPAKVKRVLDVSMLRKGHLISATIFAALAVATPFVAKTATVGETLTHVTKDELASGSQVVFAPAAHQLFEIDVRFALVAVLLVSALFSAIRATSRKVQEEKGIAARILPARWLDFGVTFAAFTAIVAMLSGFQDAAAVKLLALTVAASYFFAWLAERETTDAKQAKLFGLTGALVGLLPWAFILSSFVGTGLYGGVSVVDTWYIYAAAAILFVGQVVIAKHQKFAMNGSKAAQNYLAVERTYITLNLLTKVAAAVVLIVGLKG